jgi:hypothetical protein
MGEIGLKGHIVTKCMGEIGLKGHVVTKNRFSALTLTARLLRYIKYESFVRLGSMIGVSEKRVPF